MFINAKTEKLKKELLKLIKDYNRETDLAIISLRADALFEMNNPSPIAYDLKINIELKT